ncbi:MAG TPA: rhomboid family intramembrane serine protease [Candidatus Baltobacteraceae bacterium]
MLTRILIVTNILVFVWTYTHNATASSSSLVHYGAFYGPAVQNGEWWRAFTAAFVHDGFLHIAFNMFALWQIGTVVEQLFGTPKMALLYVLSIIGSGWAIYEFNYSEITIGASGAIFGLFGALVAAGLRLGKPGRQLVQNMIGLVLINVLLGFMIPNISQAGHLGGLVAGFLLGMLLYRVPEHLRRPMTVHVQSQGAPIEAELLPPPQQPPHQ